MVILKDYDDFINEGIFTKAKDYIVKLIKMPFFNRIKREDKIIKCLDFPFIRQSTSYTCGAVATQIILEYYGMDYHETVLAKKLKTTKSGTRIQNIIKVLEENGLSVEGKEDMTIDELKAYIDQNIPVLVMVQAYRDAGRYSSRDFADGHYVVVIGYSLKKILFSDPSQYKLTYLRNEEFLLRWHDQDGRKKYYQYGLAVFGKKPKFTEEPIKMG